MPRSPRFVVPVDFSPDSKVAVSAAIGLAMKRGGEVHLLEVVPPRGPSLLDDTLDLRLGEPIESKRDWSPLAEVIRKTAAESVPLRRVTYRGAPATLIPSYLQLVKAELLVIGQHYGTPRSRRGIRVVTSVSRESPVPVLVLPARGRPASTASLSFRHVVSAVDFTVASAVALRRVLDLIRRTGARLTLVHALKNAPRQMVFSGADARRVARALQGEAEQVAERLMKKVPADSRVRVRARVTTGEPHHGILAIASEVHADLIVMGIAPRSRLDQVLFGSTLRHVLRRTSIPVLVLAVPAGAHRWLDLGDQRPGRRLPAATAAR